MLLCTLLKCHSELVDTPAVVCDIDMYKQPWIHRTAGHCMSQVHRDGRVMTHLVSIARVAVMVLVVAFKRTHSPYQWRLHTASLAPVVNTFLVIYGC